MKTKPFGFGLLLAAGLLAVRADQCGDFSYEADGAAVTITGYTGSGGVVTILDAIQGRPVTRNGDYAFYERTGLTSVYFAGEPPADMEAFSGTPATLYHLPGTTGWNSIYCVCTTAVWVRPDPVILDFGPHFGVRTNGFGFRIAWATNANVGVEACADLAGPAWSPISTNTSGSGTWEFQDPDWAMHPVRFYRVRAE